MADERSTPARTPGSGGAPDGARRWRPPPALLGFLVLLVVVFAVAYQVGSSVGPVAPGMRSSDPGGDTGPEGGTGGAGGTGRDEGGHGGSHGGHGR
ncbi:hypothetical protein GPA10_17140 [Streptomyces sp. p1417]|uniref:Uncharacterized protein n=1 Tax=Streptomyces typhae TaxID=2681492 RepID=A0A6L6WY56_9ACTN|nr:hypothetical protein [Streptomyces typhae]MVO86439.1 hypothetical protein [Streptomyces typhae]